MLAGAQTLAFGDDERGRAVGRAGLGGAVRAVSAVQAVGARADQQQRDQCEEVQQQHRRSPAPLPRRTRLTTRGGWGRVMFKVNEHRAHVYSP